MTSTVEITYLYNDFSLKVNENIMNRAVRIKSAVKDKIKRVYDKSGLANVQENVATEKETLIDLSNLSHINDILNYLEVNKVTLTTNRAVLFTKALVSKINRVSSKWFEGMQRNTQVEMPSVDMINHLGGEVVPSTWDDSLEKEEQSLNLEPTLEKVPSIEPKEDLVIPTIDPVAEVEPTTLEKTQEDANSESNEPQENNVELPTFNENTDIYKFPSFEFNLDTTTKEEDVPSFDFVSEPTQINSSEEVPNIDTEEQNQTVEVNTEFEDKIGTLLNTEVETKPEYVSNNTDNRSSEDKIDSLLGNSNEVTNEISNEEEVNNNTIDQDTSIQIDRPAITQAQILARLQRVNNTMAEKDATIKSLTSKNESLKEEVTASKEKTSEYESRVSELTSKNTELTKENERLSTRLEESETNSQGTISKLETKLEEVTRTKTEEIDTLKKMLEELKEKHSSEIASMKESHAQEIKRVNESKDKQIQAIYSTISEALGENNLQEDTGRSISA